MNGLSLSDGKPVVELPVDFVTESSAILAKKGAGKTNAALVLIEEVYAVGVPVVSIDPKGDHWGLRAGSERDPEAGLPIPVFGGMHGDVPLEASAGAYIADLVRKRRLSVVLDVSEFTVGERARFLTAFAERLYRRPEHEPIFLVLEEAHEYIPQMVRGEDAKMVGAFERLVKLGRHKGIGVVMVTQRSASLNKNVLTQSDNLFVLRTTSPQDRAVVKSWLDYNADPVIANELASLRTGECVLVQPERGEPVRFQFRMRRTYDAGATPKVGEVRRPPATIADVDLGEISAAMADTIERAKADDPKELRAKVAQLERELRRATEATDRAVVEALASTEPERVEVPVLTDADRDKLAELDGALQALGQALTEFRDIRARVETALAPAPAARPMVVQPASRPDRQRASAESGTEGVQLRSGARRMVETLGRMYPLRLTKSQWGMVSGLKTSGGTWSTYFSEIRRLGFIDENSAGFTLTDAGFDYLGGRPEPMTGRELQDHYRGILRSGAARMLDAVMDAYPGGLTRDELGAATGIATSGGTFSTYLSDLTRNGLAEKRGDVIVATEILMNGAAA